MRENPRGDWRYEQLARVLEAAGFKQVGASGSHRTWKGPGDVRITRKDDGARGLLPVYVRKTVAAIDAASSGEDG